MSERAALYSREAEENLIGAILLTAGKCLPEIQDVITYEALYLPATRDVYRAACALDSREYPTDAVTVTEFLDQRGRLAEIGGREWIAQVVGATASASNVRTYAKIVRSYAQRRQLELAARMIYELAADPRDVDEVVAAAQEAVLAVGKEEGDAGPKPVADYMAQWIDDLDRRFHVEQEFSGISTGFRDLDRKINGLQRGDLIVIAGRPSMGKALPVNEPVLTPRGWVPNGSLMPGDFVIGPNGKPRRVLGTFPQGRQRIWRVRFADGRVVRCTAEHLWAVQHRKRVRSQVLRTDQLKPDAWLRVPAYCGTDDGELIEHRLDPYVLGCALGDGDAHGRITGLAEQFDLLKAAGAQWYTLHHDVRRPHVCSAWILDLRRQMEALGLGGCRSWQKFVPKRYLRAPRVQRIALLQGLLDTDGWVEKFGAVRFASASRQLAEDVRCLVWSLGGEASLAVKETTSLDAYVVNIRVADPRELFRLERKRARCRGPRDIAPRIVAVEQTDEVIECLCIKVDHEDGLYVTRDYIVTHNTALALNILNTIAGYGALPGLCFSMEMSGSQIVTRLVAQTGKVPLDRLLSGNLQDEHWSQIETTVDKVKRSKAVLDEAPVLLLAQIRARARRVMQRHGKLGVLVVDYLQLMTAEFRRGESRAQQIADITRGLKALAKELDTPVVVLSQLNRDVEKREDKRPRLSDLKESGSIEQDADVILFIYRDEVYNPHTKHGKIAEIIIGKQRNGPTGTVLLYYFGEYTMFGQIEHDAQQEFWSDRYGKAYHAADDFDEFGT